MLIWVRRESLGFSLFSFSLLTMLYAPSSLSFITLPYTTTFIFTLNPVINSSKLDEASRFAISSYLILLKTNMSIVPTITIIPTFPLTNGKMTKHIHCSLLA